VQPPVEHWSEESIEVKAYKSVESVPTVEMNDSNRLGYYVYLYLTGQYSSLKQAIKLAQARLLVSEEEAFNRIANHLQQAGLEVQA